MAKEPSVLKHGISLAAGTESGTDGVYVCTDTLVCSDSDRQDQKRQEQDEARLLIDEARLD